MNVKKRYAKQFAKERNHSLWLAHLMYAIAAVFNASIAASIPFSPTPQASSFIVNIQFNDFYFNGSVNGLKVQDLTDIKVSLLVSQVFC